MMFLSVIHNEKGFALPLVLGISMIIVVISFAISDSVRSKTELAIEITDKNRAYLATYSGFNETVFNIFSSLNTNYSMMIYRDEKHIKTWNLYNEDIILNKHTIVRLQDTAGLVQYLTGEGQTLMDLIDFYTQKSLEASIFKDSFLDWVDVDDFSRVNGAESYYYKNCKKTEPRNNYLQLKDELRLIRGMTPDLYEKIEKDLNVNAAGVNYLTMSADLLSAVLKDKDMADKIVFLRKKGELDSLLFYELTGLSKNEFITNTPSNKIRIQVTSKVGLSTEMIEAVIIKEQNDYKPFSILEWKR
jgi:hypothetical protein